MQLFEDDEKYMYLWRNTHHVAFKEGRGAQTLGTDSESDAATRGAAQTL